MRNRKLISNSKSQNNFSWDETHCVKGESRMRLGMLIMDMLRWTRELGNGWGLLKKSSDWEASEEHLEEMYELTRMKAIWMSSECQSGEISHVDSNFTDRIFQGAWKPHFAAPRNAMISKKRFVIFSSKTANFSTCKMSKTRCYDTSKSHNKATGFLKYWIIRAEWDHRGGISQESRQRNLVRRSSEKPETSVAVDLQGFDVVYNIRVIFSREFPSQLFLHVVQTKW